MRKITIWMVIFIFVLCCGAGLAEAKRKPPKEPLPASYEDIEFIAPHERIGYVEAWDIKTCEKFWEQKVYDIKIDPKLEKDVQRIFITKLGFNDDYKDHKLIVENEKQEKYEIDLKIVRDTQREYRKKREDDKKIKDFKARIDQFITDGFEFKFGNNQYQIINNLGPPNKIEKREFQDIHYPEQTDESTDLYYDGLIVHIINKILISSIEVTSDKYKMKWGLNVGCSKDHVKEILGNHCPEKNGKLTYTSSEDLGSYEHKLYFYFKENKVIKIEWSYYID